MPMAKRTLRALPELSVAKIPGQCTARDCVLGFTDAARLAVVHGQPVQDPQGSQAHAREKHIAELNRGLRSRLQRGPEAQRRLDNQPGPTATLSTTDL
ncbi:hypothetical protein MAPG_11894 [Magnaporthiopsis poae ATCC 64411]|uniref:Uncharacterized protein n=1 Tax=Magnaporthiopsis poae (strain ATCC 64411 / 73-15) TaxID=644358 RepID=A0A0C4EGF5_MAGP6|nr:hypothetical protein MAPG_11894 [Magnaporthiopsis poae ATCC 64411]